MTTPCPQCHGRKIIVVSYSGINRKGQRFCAVCDGKGWVDKDANFDAERQIIRAGRMHLEQRIRRFMEEEGIADPREVEFLIGQRENFYTGGFFRRSSRRKRIVSEGPEVD